MSIPRFTPKKTGRAPVAAALHLDIKSIWDATGSFEVLQTAKNSQTAVMRLEPGESSSEQKNVHHGSDQVLYVVDGEVFAEVGEYNATLRAGDSIIVSADSQHKFTNRGNKAAVTFNVYSPPEYPQ